MPALQVTEHVHVLQELRREVVRLMRPHVAGWDGG
jgi:hypothetical protein